MLGSLKYSGAELNFYTQIFLMHLLHFVSLLCLDAPVERTTGFFLAPIFLRKGMLVKSADAIL